MLFQGREWFFAMWKEVVVSQQWHAATLKKLLSDHFHRKAWGCMEKPRKLSRSSFRCTKRHVGNVKCYVIIQLHRAMSARPKAPKMGKKKKKVNKTKQKPTQVYVTNLFYSQHVHDLIKQRGSQQVSMNSKCFQSMKCNRIFTLSLWLRFKTK